MCNAHTRRHFLTDVGLGFGGLALNAMIQQETAAAPSKAHHKAKAKSVIWIFLSGGYSHMESFDPKPALTKYAGKTYSQTPFPNPVESPLHKQRFRSVPSLDINVRDVYPTIYPMQVGFDHYGEQGIGITDWWPHLAKQVDDICLVRNMWTTDNDHAAENQIHTGRHRLDETQPSIGSWVHYGLGTLNENLPKFVVLGGPTRSDTRDSIDSYYLGPSHAGIPLSLENGNPLPYSNRHPNHSEDLQRREFTLVNQLNKLTLADYKDDKQLLARIKSYELAYKMQSSIPEAVNLADETEATHAMYGLGNPTTAPAGNKLLAARRLVERGVRFIQVFPTPYGRWDAHRDLKKNHTENSAKVDLPVAGLITDLKQRGLLDETLIVFCTEFGRTPGLEERAGGATGRDHHPNGFTIFLAGGGTKGGYVHGATDELGYHALGDAHYVTDLHATVLYSLGLDSPKLDIDGRKRLEIDHGRPILDVFA